MRILADENQHARVVARLRAAGHDVEWLAESTPGASDATILGRGDIGSLILLTDDRDFGELIFHRRSVAPWAVIYTRLNRTAPDVIADRLLRLLEAGVGNGHMTIITKDGARTRPFPPGATNG